MKIIAVAAVLLMTPVLAPGCLAQSLGETTGVNAMLDRQPTGTDVLMEIHQFDLFQQAADESAQQRGDGGLREFSASHSQAAEKQDKELGALASKAGMKIDFPDTPNSTASSQLASLEGSVGPDFVRGYYGAQVSEYDAVVSSLKRYLEKPDNDGVKAYAARQLPLFTAGQTSAKDNWDRSKQ